MRSMLFSCFSVLVIVGIYVVPVSYRHNDTMELVPDQPQEVLFNKPLNKSTAFCNISSVSRITFRYYNPSVTMARYPHKTVRGAKIDPFFREKWLNRTMHAKCQRVRDNVNNFGKPRFNPIVKLALGTTYDPLIPFGMVLLMQTIILWAVMQSPHRVNELVYGTFGDGRTLQCTLSCLFMGVLTTIVAADIYDDPKSYRLYQSFVSGDGSNFSSIHLANEAPLLNQDDNSWQYLYDPPTVGDMSNLYVIVAPRNVLTHVNVRGYKHLKGRMKLSKRTYNVVPFLPRPNVCFIEGAKFGHSAEKHTTVVPPETGVVLHQAFAPVSQQRPVHCSKSSAMGIYNQIQSMVTQSNFGTLRVSTWTNSIAKRIYGIYTNIRNKATTTLICGYNATVLPVQPFNIQAHFVSIIGRARHVATLCIPYTFDQFWTHGTLAHQEPSVRRSNHVSNLLGNVVHYVVALLNTSLGTDMVLPTERNNILSWCPKELTLENIYLYSNNAATPRHHGNGTSVPEPEYCAEGSVHCRNETRELCPIQHRVSTDTKVDNYLHKYKGILVVDVPLVRTPYNVEAIGLQPNTQPVPESMRVPPRVIVEPIPFPESLVAPKARDLIHTAIFLFKGNSTLFYIEFLWWVCIVSMIIWYWNFISRYLAQDSPRPLRLRRTTRTFAEQFWGIFKPAPHRPKKRKFTSRGQNTDPEEPQYVNFDTVFRELQCVDSGAQTTEFYYAHVATQTHAGLPEVVPPTPLPVKILPTEEPVHLSAPKAVRPLKVYDKYRHFINGLMQVEPIPLTLSGNVPQRYTAWPNSRMPRNRAKLPGAPQRRPPSKSDELTSCVFHAKNNLTKLRVWLQYYEDQLPHLNLLIRLGESMPPRPTGNLGLIHPHISAKKIVAKADKFLKTCLHKCAGSVTEDLRQTYAGAEFSNTPPKSTLPKPPTNWVIPEEVELRPPSHFCSSSHVVNQSSSSVTIDFYGSPLQEDLHSATPSPTDQEVNDYLKYEYPL